MATMNFSVPLNVKEAFDKAFRRQNKSAVLTELMRQAVEDGSGVIGVPRPWRSYWRCGRGLDLSPRKMFERLGGLEGRDDGGARCERRREVDLCGSC